MAKKDRSFFMRVLMFPFVAVGALLSLALWIFSFRFVRKLAWKGVKRKLDKKYGTAQEDVVDVEAREKTRHS